MVALILFIVLLGLKVGFGRLADFEFDAGSVPFATTIAPPMPCITNESELAYNRAGYVSAQYSFLNCLANVDSPDLIPTFYNGMINGVLNVNISLGLNNLASVRVYSSLNIHVFHLASSSFLVGCSGRNSDFGFLFAALLVRSTVSDAFDVG